MASLGQTLAQAQDALTALAQYEQRMQSQLAQAIADLSGLASLEAGFSDALKAAISGLQAITVHDIRQSDAKYVRAAVADVLAKAQQALTEIDQEIAGSGAKTE